MLVYILKRGLPLKLLTTRSESQRVSLYFCTNKRCRLVIKMGPDVYRGYSYSGLEKVGQCMIGDEDEGAK